MRGGLLFGLLFGAVVVLVPGLVGERLGRTIVWSLLALWSGISSVVVWRRMRLGLFAASGIAGSAAWATVAWFTWRGYTLETIPASWLIATVVAFCMVVSAMLFKPFRDREKWEAWRRASESAGLMDMLRFRHIPDLNKKRHDMKHGRA